MLISELLKYIDEIMESDSGDNGYSDSIKLSWINEIGEQIAIYKAGEKTAYEPITKIMEDTATVCKAPFDQMYVNFILAKMSYYNKDYESYAQHISQYNQLFSEYMSWCRRNTKEVSRWEGWL